MIGTSLLLISILGIGPNEYPRPLNAKKLDQPTLDAEGYGEKKAFKREDDGLRITLAPGEKETGWKTPQALRFGGDFTIKATVLIRKLPKPAQEDGAAVGLAIAFQSLDQPDATLVRLIEPTGSDVYRSVEKASNNPMMMQQQQMQMQMMMMRGMMPQQGGKPPKAPRPTFPAAGDLVQLEIQREGNTVRFQVLDAKSDKPRYLGQAALGNGDVAALKLFASNRNGAEPINVLLRDVTIRADRISGLGTAVRTVFGEVVHGEPTGLEKGLLIIDGEPKTPPGGAAPTAAPGVAPAQPVVPTPGPEVMVAPAGGMFAVALAPPGAQIVIAAPPAVAVAPAPPPAAAPAPAPAPAAAPPPASAPPQQPASKPDSKFLELPADVFVAEKPKPKVPKAKITLDEVESIKFERPAPAMSGRVIGQVNLDFTGVGLSAKKPDETAKKPDPKADPKKPAADDVLAPPPGTAEVVKYPKVEAKPSGIRDLRISLANLHAADIKQVMVNCQTDKGPAAWRLDTTDSQDWPLVVKRSGSEAWADIFLEPPNGDCFQKDFTINVTFADGQNGNAQAKSNEHTDAKLALDSKAAPTALLNAWVFLTDDEKLFGKLEKVTEESLQLTTPWQDKLEIPLARVIGIYLAQPERKEMPEAFAKRLKSRSTDDLLLARTKDAEVVAIAGIFEGSDESKLTFRYQDKSRTLPITMVEGIVMATRPEAKESAELAPTYVLPNGMAISGKWKDLDTAIWKVETPWGQELKLPAPEVQSVRFRGGKMTYLSDLVPSKVEEAPFFGRRLSWKRNVNLLGQPLKMNGQTFERGLAVHSRCVLTYDLNRAYTTFEAFVGFDETMGVKGRVDCRVFADGKEIYANPDLRADGPPLSAQIAGRRRRAVEAPR